MEEEGQPEMDVLLDLAFSNAKVWKLCCIAAASSLDSLWWN